MNKLDIAKLNKGKSQNIKIGELTPKVITLLNLNLNPQNIFIWSPRIQEHCEKHKYEYSSIDAYNNAICSIPEIIQNPDYVGLHPNGNIQYVKKLDDISLIGLKIIKGNGNLLFRTIYPISKAKLDIYLNKKRFFPLK